MVTIWYNSKGKPFFSKESALKQGEQETDLSSVEVENIPDSFPIKYCGRRYVDNISQRIIDDVEIEYQYIVDVINKTLKKLTWVDRFYLGEFTLADFQAKVLKKLKVDYSLITRESDSIFSMYTKRKNLDLLEEGDLEKFTLYMTAYKDATIQYRTLRDRVKNASTIEELYEVWGIQYSVLEGAYVKLSGIVTEPSQLILTEEEINQITKEYESILTVPMEGTGG